MTTQRRFDILSHTSPILKAIDIACAHAKGDDISYWQHERNAVERDLNLLAAQPAVGGVDDADVDVMLRQVEDAYTKGSDVIDLTVLERILSALRTAPASGSHGSEDIERVDYKEWYESRYGNGSPGGGYPMGEKAWLARAERVALITQAFDAAMMYIQQLGGGSGGSFATDIFVALAAVQCGIVDDNVRSVIAAYRRQQLEPKK